MIGVPHVSGDVIRIFVGVIASDPGIAGHIRAERRNELAEMQRQTLVAFMVDLLVAEENYLVLGE